MPTIYITDVCIHKMSSIMGDRRSFSCIVFTEITSITRTPIHAWIVGQSIILQPQSLNPLDRSILVTCRTPSAQLCMQVIVSQ